MGVLFSGGGSSSGGGGAVTVADGADVTQGATTDAAVITDTTGTLSGKLRGLVKWAFERMPVSLGQKTMANSLAVVIASDQTVVASETTLGLRLSETDFDTKIGSLTEAAPATDTASSGLNGRLQRIAQRLTSLIALLPTALVGGRLDTNIGTWLGSTAPTVGSKTSANSVPVVIASDQGSFPVAATLNAETTKVIGTVNQGTYFGKTISYVSVAQGAAGTTQLKAASASNKHKVVGAILTMSAAGTLKFTDGVGDLTGAMDVATQGGFVLPTGILPFFETSTTNTALSIVTVTGAAKGVVAIITEP